MAERKTYYFECQCNDESDRLVYNLWEDTEGEPTLMVHVFLGSGPWYRRIWKGLKYIFGYKCRYGHFGEHIFKPEDMWQMRTMMNKYSLAYERATGKRPETL